MLRSSFLFMLLALLVFVTPAVAQDGNISIGVFMTIDVKDTEDFESSLAEHAQWHASQNDPWAWVAYQAMGGATEYAVISSNHQWSDLDNPAVDMGADQAEFANSEGAQLLTSEELGIWESLPEYGNAPAGPMPIVQVSEFQVQGNEDLFLLGMAKFKEAAGDGGSFGWSRVVSNDGPPTYFVAVYANTFAELGAPGPNPVEIMQAAHGFTETHQILEGFSSVATNTSNRIWIMRPDLSHMGN